MQGEIKVEIEGDLMVVSLHGTSYRAIYFKSPLEPKLIQAPNLTVEKEGSTTHKEFEAMAWKAAIAKARELRWIASVGYTLRQYRPTSFHLANKRKHIRYEFNAFGDDLEGRTAILTA